MSVVSPILSKIFVREFYRVNASFFLLVLGFAAGFMRGQDHIALAEFFISHSWTMLIPILVWVLYTLKVIQFNRETLHRRENEWVYHISFFSRQQQWQLATTTIVSLQAPVIAYAIFLMATAAKHFAYISMILAGVTVIVLVLLSASVWLKQIHHPNGDRVNNALFRFLNKSFTRPMVLFFPEWIIRRQFLATVGIKVFSLLLLWSIIFLYTTDHYDSRLLAMALVISFAMQVQTVWELHRFDNFHFSLLRQLPLSFGKRLQLTITTICLLVIPEIGLIITRFPESLSWFVLAESLLFYLSGFILMYGLQYVRDTKPESLTSWVFLVSMILIVLILFKTPMVLLATINVFAGVFVWKKFYFRFEYLAENETILS